MAADEEMTIDERRKYLKQQWTRYRVADRTEKSRLLSEMEAVTGLHRKSLVRLLNQPSLARRPAANRRGRTHGPEVEQVIVVVWESLDYVCAERLQPALLGTAQHLARFGEIHRSPQLETQLGQISLPTVQRLLQRHRRPPLRLLQKGPEAANRLRQAVRSAPTTNQATVFSPWHPLHSSYDASLVAYATVLLGVLGPHPTPGRERDALTSLSPLLTTQPETVR